MIDEDKDIISPDILEAIAKCAERIPKKQRRIDNFCLDYDVDHPMELDEQQGLELLETIDSRAYGEILRSRDKAQHEIDKAELRDELGYRLNNNPDYVLVAHNQDCFIVAKKVKFSVNSSNNNNVFQPYSATNDKEYVIMMIIYTGYDDGGDQLELEADLLRVGCHTVRVKTKKELSFVLEGL